MRMGVMMTRSPISGERWTGPMKVC